MMAMWDWKQGDLGSKLERLDGSDINRIFLKSIDIRFFSRK